LRWQIVAVSIQAMNEHGHGATPSAVGRDPSSGGGPSLLAVTGFESLWMGVAIEQMFV
jgi:hypothetical protein